jgi:RNA polymerase sigma-70 factor (ECF subfamily)
MTGRRHSSSERLEAAVGQVAPSPLSDELLMEGFGAGDRRALEQLFARHAYSLFQLLRRMVRDEDAAEDLLQTTFLSLVKSRESYQRGAKVAPWLHAIAANAARDWLRRQRRHPEEHLEVEEMAEQELPADAPAESEPRDPQLAQRVKRALQRLPPSQREAVLLHRLEGLSFREIARSLGTTVGAAKVRAHRGYQKLRRILGKF